jgi:hypothetical protein
LHSGAHKRDDKLRQSLAAVILKEKGGRSSAGPASFMTISSARSAGVSAISL